MQMSRCRGWEGEMGMNVNGYVLSFRYDKNVLNVDYGGAWATLSIY